MRSLTAKSPVINTVRKKVPAARAVLWISRIKIDEQAVAINSPTNDFLTNLKTIGNQCSLQAKINSSSLNNLNFSI